MTNDREQRIRALAGLHMMRGDFSAENPPQPYETAHFLAKAARIIDAIDALPVPGDESIACGICAGFGTVLDHGVRIECPVCNGTGKAER